VHDAIIESLLNRLTVNKSIKNPLSQFSNVNILMEKIESGRFLPRAFNAGENRNFWFMSQVEQRVQWVAKVMTPVSMYFLWKQGHAFCGPLYSFLEC